MLNADTTEALYDFQFQGRRTSKTRLALLTVFEAHPEPLCLEDLQRLLKETGWQPHRVTLYREIEFLKAEKLLTTVMLPDGKLRYELAQRTHHHHLMCMKCQSIEDIELQDELGVYEAKIATSKHFKVLRHNLDFIGLCASCQAV